MDERNFFELTCRWLMVFPAGVLGFAVALVAALFAASLMFLCGAGSLAIAGSPFVGAIAAPPLVVWFATIAAPFARATVAWMMYGVGAYIAACISIFHGVFVPEFYVATAVGAASAYAIARNSLRMKTNRISIRADESVEIHETNTIKDEYSR